MKKDTKKLESHLRRHPTDAAGVISLLKKNSYNYEYDFRLKKKQKLEKVQSIRRKRLGEKHHGH